MGSTQSALANDAAHLKNKPALCWVQYCRDVNQGFYHCSVQVGVLLILVLFYELLGLRQSPTLAVIAPLSLSSLGGGSHVLWSRGGRTLRVVTVSFSTRM